MGVSWAPTHSPLPPRSHLAEATALYSLVDEQLHVLVTTSNHLLGRLELCVRLGRLEAAIHQVRGKAGPGHVGDFRLATSTGQALLQAWPGACSSVRTQVGRSPRARWASLGHGT